MTKAHFFSALPASAAKTPPDWVKLIPNGAFKARDGRGPFRLTDAQAVAAASMARGKIPFDENHSTELAAKAGHSSPATGWIVDMQAREDGIWGRVNWNARGRELLVDDAYSGVSPVFTTGQGNVVKAITSAALTNDPALDLPHLNSRTRVDMDLSELAHRLGLSEAATEADVDRALAAARDARTMCSQLAVLGGVDQASAPETVIEAVRKKLDDTNKELLAVRADASKGKILAAMDKAAAEGKEISDALKTSLLSVGETQPENAIAMLAALPVSGVAGKHLAHAGRRAAVEQEVPEAEAIATEVAGIFGHDPKVVIAAMKGGDHGAVC